jgi:8-oxo-dGTP pyrophosphatase MutT (NUDIX family)
VCFEHQRLKKRPGALYVVVSLGSMQAINFSWLAQKGFRFHHYRNPRHDATPAESTLDHTYSSEQEASSAADQETAELVYYCWPGETHDMVPVYSTSIEGVTGLVFSRDESMLLMVWERKAWGTPGGAVDAGESKLDALERECMEEVQLSIDRDWAGTRYLGGWHEQCARDCLINDNFSVFAVRCADEHIKVDGVEINEARWLPWRTILDAWRRMGRPSGDKRVPMPDLSAIVGQQLPEGRVDVLLNVLQWLETYERGMGFAVQTKREKKGTKLCAKTSFSAAP